MLRGGIGNYYGRTPSIMTGTAFTQNGIQVQTYTLTANFPTYPGILSAPPTLNRTPDIYVFAKDYVQPLTYQWSLNLERQLGRDYAVTLGYLGVRGEHLSRTRDINFLPVGATAGQLRRRHAGHVPPPPGRANPAFGRISLFDSGADSIYHGGFVQLSKRFSQNFQVQTSYTFSKVIDSRPTSPRWWWEPTTARTRRTRWLRTWSAAAAMPISAIASCSPASGTSTTASRCRTRSRASCCAATSSR